jgi:acyl-CoA synthetase (AMP-forming)/AMP-acid ligase II
MTETSSGVITQRAGGGGIGKVAPKILSDKELLTITCLGSIGVLVPNIECKIINEKGEELGDDQEGEFLFRGPSIMKGYFNNPKANAEVFTGDGWMRTGDVGKFQSATGEFFILDRIKELIKYKGLQVAPAELEAVIMGLDIVADVCVVGVYDNSQATEIPRAYVVLQPSVENNDKTYKQIDDYVTSNVTNYKKLRGGIKFVDTIPKSPSGKILRRQVKEWVKKEQSEPSKSRL